MAGSDSAITAVLAVKNDMAKFVTGSVEANDTAYAYLDISTMDGGKVIFIIEEAGADLATILIKDGAAFSAGTIGDLKEATTASGEYIVGPFETSRFKDSNGYIRVGMSSASSSVLNVRAILLP